MEFIFSANKNEDQSSISQNDEEFTYSLVLVCCNYSEINLLMITFNGTQVSVFLVTTSYLWPHEILASNKLTGQW